MLIFYRLECARNKNIRWLTINFTLFDRTELLNKIVKPYQQDHIEYKMEFADIKKGFCLYFTHKAPSNYERQYEDDIVFQ